MTSNESPTLARYRDTMKDCIKLYYPNARDDEIYAAIEYSIQKRLKDDTVKISNSYKKRRTIEKDQFGNEHYVFKNTEQSIGLQKLTDYILSRQPIVTAFGTMFMHHGETPNPLMEVVQSFLDARGIHKKQMLSFPKGSEEYEKYNLLQSLDKIDSNGRPIIWFQKLHDRHVCKPQQ